jgi:SET domain-containing protein
VKLLGSGLLTKERSNTSLGNGNSVTVPVISSKLTQHIIDATRKGGIARYINHSCQI